MLKSKPYVKLAGAEFTDIRLERVFIKAKWRETIRLSDWRGGRLSRRAVALTEDELLVLLGNAIAAQVFSAQFSANFAPFSTRKRQTRMLSGKQEKMATQISLDRWIVVSVRDTQWAPYPGTALFETQSDAQEWVDAATKSRVVGPNTELLVKHVLLSEIV